MNIRRREFLVAGGVALLAGLQRSDAVSTKETFEPDLASQTHRGSLLPLAPDTFFGNSSPMGGQWGKSFCPVNADTAHIRWSPGGYVYNASFWTENHINPGIFNATNGNTLGQPSDGSHTTQWMCALGAPDNSLMYAMYAMTLVTAPLSGGGQPLLSNTGVMGGYALTTHVTLPGASNSLATGMAMDATNIYIASPGAAGFVDTPPDSGHPGRYSPARATISVVSLSNLAAVARSWTAPYVRTLSIDSSGRIWALSQAQLTGKGSPRSGAIYCYTTAGALVGYYTLPSTVYPVDIACDPNSSTILVADNSRDQNIKKYDFSGVASATGQAAVATKNGPNPGSYTVGVQYGYLDSTAATKGTIGANRFCGLRSICMDSSSAVYVAQNRKPGYGDYQWCSQANGTIFIKQDSSGNLVWWRYSLEVGGYGIPSQDASYAFTDDYLFQRSNTGVYDGYGGAPSYAGTNSQYVPIAMTLDTFTYPSDPRSKMGSEPASNEGMAVYEWQANGQTYLVTWSQGGTVWIHRLVTGTYIFAPCVAISGSTITTDGTPRSWSGWAGLSDFAIDDSYNLWGLDNRNNRLWRLRLQGYNANHSPEYSSNVDSYAAPPAFSGGQLRRFEVHGSNVYISGYASGDSDLSVWQGAGRLLAKYPSLPSPSWPSPEWQYRMYAWSTNSNNDNYPQCFSVDPSIPVVAVVYRQGSTVGTVNGQWDWVNDSTGTYMSSTYMQTSLPWGEGGAFDMYRCMVARNGYLWCEDDWGNKVWGLETAGHGAP